MLFRFCLPLVLLVSSTVKCQFKNDNILYKTVDPSDLCATLANNKEYILLDVRSKGEFYDTSSSPSYNLGHLKGAININARELGQRISEIRQYKNKPVFLYCSHSQRSRRAGKMLADSGFTNLFNINGGMTAIHYSNLKEKGCLKNLVETAVNYSIISPLEVCDKMAQPKAPFILDVRSDSAFRHISSNEKENAYGAFVNTVNIPLAQLTARLSELPKNKEIIITDIYGEEASQAAVLLKKNGFKDVSVLIEGIDRLVQMDGKKLGCKNILYTSPVTYNLLSTVEFGRFSSEKIGYLLLDVRSVEEFTNKHKDTWRNIGRIKGAVNVPADQLEKTEILPGYENIGKGTPVVIYSFGNSPEIFASAVTMQKKGYTNVHVLIGGLFNLRWTAGNVQGQSFLKEYVEDIPEINQ